MLYLSRRRLNLEARDISVNWTSYNLRSNVPGGARFVELRRKWWFSPRLGSLIALCAFACVLLSGSFAQDAGEHRTASVSADDSIAIENPGVAVEVDGRPVLTIYAPVGGFTPQERARAIGHRILALSNARGIPLDTIRSEDR